MLRYLLIAICITVQMFGFAVCGMNVQKKIHLQSLNISIYQQEIRFYNGQANLAFYVAVLFLTIAIFLLMRKG